MGKPLFFKFLPSHLTTKGLPLKLSVNNLVNLLVKQSQSWSRMNLSPHINDNPVSSCKHTFSLLLTLGWFFQQKNHPCGMISKENVIAPNRRLIWCCGSCCNATPRVFSQPRERKIPAKRCEEMWKKHFPGNITGLNAALGLQNVEATAHPYQSNWIRNIGIKEDN